MESRSITPLLSSLDTDAWLFAYGGDFTEDHSARLLELASLAGGQFDGFNAKQAGYVLVEAYQNIIRHRAKLPVSGSCGPGEGLFVFRIDRNGLGVYTGNAVTGSAASELDQALASLRNKDASELKLLFLRGIQQPGSPGQRGAGLGLIEMVRRSGADPKWSFGPMHAGHQWFSLVLEQEARPRQDSLQALVEEHLCPWMLGNGVVCLQVAPWSPGLGETLMRMARTEVPLRSVRLHVATGRGPPDGIPASWQGPTPAQHRRTARPPKWVARAPCPHVRGGGTPCRPAPGLVSWGMVNGFLTIVNHKLVRPRCGGIGFACSFSALLPRRSSAEATATAPAPGSTCEKTAAHPLA